MCNDRKSVFDAAAAVREQERLDNNARMDAEREAKASIKAAQLSEAVALLMDKNAQERHSLGLLDEDEIRQAVQANAFKSLDASFEKYIFLRAGDIDHEDTCYDADVDFNVSAADSISADEYVRLSEIKAAAPGADVKVTEHVAACDSCRATRTRRSITVKITDRAVTSTRHYSV